MGYKEEIFEIQIKICEIFYKSKKENNVHGQLDKNKFNSFHQNSDYIEIAINDLCNINVLEERQPHSLSMTGYGILWYEENETTLISNLYFNDLLYPILSILLKNEYRRNIIENLQKNFGIICTEKDKDIGMFILNSLSFIKLTYLMRGYSYNGVTAEGKEWYYENKEPNEIDLLIEKYHGKLNELDYVKDSRIRLIDWLNQFTSDDEKKAALFLVGNLKIIKNQYCIDKWKEFYFDKLQSIPEEDLRFFAAGKSGSSGTKWQHLFLREIKAKEKGRNVERFENNDEQYWTGKIIVIIDDIIGSGTQFKGFIEKYLLRNGKFRPELDNTRIIYFTPISTEHGKKYVESIGGGRIEIYSGIEFKKFFDDENEIWKKSHYLAKDEIEKFCRKYAKIIGFKQIDLLGYNDSQLLVTFQDHTPDNMIPILWWEENWTPLLKR